MDETRVGPSLAELLRRCAEGDRSAFRLLYDRQGAQLYAIALRITRQSSLAADAVQEAFIQIWQNAARFDAERGNAEAWMIGLTRYRALDLIRRTGREVYGVEIPEPADDDPDPLQRLLATSEGRALRRCLDALDRDKRRAVMLAFVDGYSHSELAEKLTLPMGTVKSWIRRGLAGLRRCLES